MAKFNHIDNIHAKTFFDILKTKNFELLEPRPNEKGLDVLFMSIYDDFFLRSDNYEAKEYLRLTKEIASLEYKKATLKQLLHFYYTNPHTEKMRADFAEFLKSKYKTTLDITKPFAEEVHRILTIQVGYIDNDLVLLQYDFDRMVSESKSQATEFYDDLANLGQVLTGNSLVKDDVILGVYVSLMKVAKKKNEQENKKK